MQFAKPSLATLFSSLAGDTRNLIRQEFLLAKTELGEKISKMGRSTIQLAVGGVVAYAGLIVFIISLGWLAGWALGKAGLDPALAVFVGLSIVGLLVAATGCLLLNSALKNFSAKSLSPEKTIQTIQELKGSNAQEEFEAALAKARNEKLDLDQMQARVEATETRLGDTLEELGYRFSPEHVKAQVRDRICENPYRAGFVAMGFGLVGGLFLRRKFERT